MENKRKNLPDSLRPTLYVGPEALKDEITARDETARAASSHNARADKRTLCVFFWGIGGFLVFEVAILLLTFRTTSSLLLHIPNRALAAIVFRNSTLAHTTLTPFFPWIAALDPSLLTHATLVVLPSPLDAGLIIQTPEKSDALSMLGNTDASITPLRNGFVALGSSSFGARIAHLQPIPWWTATRLWFLAKQHPAALLVSQNTDEPWLFGTMDQMADHTKITIPTTEPSADPADVVAVLKNATAVIIPSKTTLLLPDNTRTNELRYEPNSLTETTEKTADHEMTTIMSQNKPLFMISFGPHVTGFCDSSHAATLSVFSSQSKNTPVFSISLLKQGIVLCF